MRSTVVRRSLEEIADDIISALEPLKYDFDKTRAEILGVLSNYQKCGLPPKIGAVSVIRKRAKRALDALVALEEVFPPIRKNHSDPAMWLWNMVDLLADIERTSRADISQVASAYLAGTLVVKYSRREPVMTEAKRDGNVHAIAQWLFEAATGEQIAKNKPAGMLWAVQKVHRWPVNATASK
jgi:hypothetical protein